MLDATSHLLLAIGGIFLLGLATDLVGKRTPLPRVTLLLILGVVIGEHALNLVPLSLTQKFDIIAQLALVMVGFLLGGRLTVDSLKQTGKQILAISICTVVVTVVLMTSALYLVGVPLQVALLLGCIGSATAPAACVDIVVESGKTGPFSDLLLAVVALDDAWALIIFSFGLAVVSSMNGHGSEWSSLADASYDIGGALILGAAIGIPAAFLTGRLKPGEPILSEALGLVLICAGLALWAEVSFLIAAMTMGVFVGNIAKHHNFAFHEIENIEWPIMSLFFVLAGAVLEVHALMAVGLVGLAYVFSRITGKVFGAWLGAWLGGTNQQTQRWMGAALLPQAGAAIGMSLVATDQYPQYKDIVLPIVIGSTVFFEIIGPVFAKLALEHTSKTSSYPSKIVSQDTPR